MLDEILADYLRIFPTEIAGLERLLGQIKAGEKLNDRRNFNGHVTGSAIVLSTDGTKILLIHHKLFNRWQQPGGHWESDEEASPLVAAQREGEEETGVQIAEYVPLDPTHPLVPLNIDSHEVPARDHKNEPMHWHHDFRYVFIAASEAVTHQASEVSAARWFGLTSPETELITRTMIKLASVINRQ